MKTKHKLTAIAKLGIGLAAFTLLLAAIAAVHRPAAARAAQ